MGGGEDVFRAVGYKWSLVVVTLSELNIYVAKWHKYMGTALQRYSRVCGR